MSADIDLDFADRDQVLQLIKATPAHQVHQGQIRRHNSGVYVTDIPYDPVNDMAAIDYVEAEQRGYFKLDLLNVHVYSQVRDELHLATLMRDPNWGNLNKREFVEKLIHLGNHYQSLQKMPSSVDSIPRLAMFLALIRPAKRHLIGQSWADISKSIWDKNTDGYSFKKSHAVAYAHLVVVHMNLIEEQN